MVVLPFSKRLTASSAVFACLFIASPQGATILTTNVTAKSALQLDYGALVNIYPELIHQDTANDATDLSNAISAAVIAVEGLNATIDALMAAGDSGFILAGMQIVVANALTSLKAAQSSS